MRGSLDEASAPKYAHIERERRWKVDSRRRPELQGLGHILIEDRYIERTRLRLRRMMDCVSGSQVLKLTKKYDASDPLARAIVTAYLSEIEYQVLLALPARALSKRRFHIVDGGCEFSLDQFQGRLDGLELIEIEWSDDAGLRALVPPLWAEQEVSDDPHYQGGWLAANGLPEA